MSASEERLRLLAEQLQRAINSRDVEGTIAVVRQLDQEQVDVLLSFTPHPVDPYAGAGHQWQQTYPPS